MRAVLRLLYAITALLHVVFALVVNQLLQRQGVPGALAWSATGSLALAIAFYFRMQLQLWDRPISRSRRYLEELYYIHWFALLLLIATVPVTLAVGVALDTGSPANRVDSIVDAATWGYLAGVVIAIWAVVIRRRVLRVVTHQLKVHGLPERFHGYRIAQLSDIHVGSLMPKERLRRWSTRVASERVDVVALTGDYVTTGVRFHADIAEGLAPLKAADGVFAIMGNHDYFGEGEPLMSLLGQNGVRVLRNESVLLKRGDEQIRLVGIDDRYTKRENVEQAMADHDDDTVCVVLVHNPVTFPELVERGVALVLAGHTHWGQVALPFFPQVNVTRRHMRHHTGWYHEDNSALYVHPGVGTTGPPIRLGTWPEVAIIELLAA